MALAAIVDDNHTKVGWTGFATYLNAQVVKKNRFRRSCRLHAHTARKKVNADGGPSENQFKS